MPLHLSWYCIDSITILVLRYPKQETMVLNPNVCIHSIVDSQFRFWSSAKHSWLPSLVVTILMPLGISSQFQAVPLRRCAFSANFFFFFFNLVEYSVGCQKLSPCCIQFLAGLQINLSNNEPVSHNLRRFSQELQLFLFALSAGSHEAEALTMVACQILQLASYCAYFNLISLTPYLESVCRLDG